MIPNPNPTIFFALIVGILAFIFIMLLPALVETKKPKDAGPRIIVENFSLIPEVKGKPLLPNIEDEHKFDQTIIQKVAETLRFLHNLEA
jgi:hypothetical protein